MQKILKNPVSLDRCFEICLYGQISTITQICPFTTTTMTSDQPTLLDDLNFNPQLG